MDSFVLQYRTVPLPGNEQHGLLVGGFAIVLCAAEHIEEAEHRAEQYLRRAGWEPLEQLEAGLADMEVIAMSPDYEALFRAFQARGIACEIAAGAFSDPPGPPS